MDVVFLETGILEEGLVKRNIINISFLLPEPVHSNSELWAGSKGFSFTVLCSEGAGACISEVALWHWIHISY